MPTLRQQLDDLIRTLEPSVQRAFIEAVEDIRSQIVLERIVEALERRDVEAAIRALHIESAAFQPLAEALRQAFGQGGSVVIQAFPVLPALGGDRIVMRWDMSQQRAVQIVAEHAARAVQGISEATKQVARETIAYGLERGIHGRTIAYELAGRRSRVTGKREGGIIGLTSQQAEFVRSAREILSDPERIREYLRWDKAEQKWVAKYSKTDKRLIPSIVKAIKEGRALDAEKIGKITTGLKNSYLKLRADNIALFETGEAVANSQHEAFQQMLDRTGRDASLVTRKWKSAGDGRVRHSHVELNNRTMQGMDEPFETILGNFMRFPFDSKYGAGLEDRARCRCICEYNFDFAEAYARSRGR